MHAHHYNKEGTKKEKQKRQRTKTHKSEISLLLKIYRL
jgi:hypothetical protein